jgi:hypothetical protein
MHYLNEHLRKYVTVKSGVNYNALIGTTTLKKR